MLYQIKDSKSLDDNSGRNAHRRNNTKGQSKYNEK